MHYRKKKLIDRGMNESAQILNQTIDYTETTGKRLVLN